MLRVLNKDIPLQELYPLEILIRRIIDGPMDVDKGDYLPRDSYHCGVNYGVYDHHFLWDKVFGDELSSCVPDPDHSVGETRYLLFCASSKGRHLVVSFTERVGAIRITSARRMTRKEKSAYES